MVRGSVNKCASRVDLADEAPFFPRDNYVSTHVASFKDPLKVGASKGMLFRGHNIREERLWKLGRFANCWSESGLPRCRYGSFIVEKQLVKQNSHN